jgi:hypothetical protein
MSHKLNLVRVLTAATGNSTPIVLGAAYSQLFMLPSEAGAMDGRTYSYLIVDGNNWELGRGAYTASGTTLARNVIASRVSGTLGTSRISLTGTAQVRFVDAAEDMDGVRGTRPVTGTTDTLNNSDLGFVVTYSNAAAVAVSLAQAGASGLFLDGWATYVKNKGAGVVTITPATSTIDGAATLVLVQNQGALIWSDGTNYQSFRLSGSAPLLAANNLADLVSASTARTNLGATSTGSALFMAANADAVREIVPNPGALFGLALSTAGSSASFGVSAGFAADSTNVNLMKLPSAYTKLNTSWAVGSGNGSLDTGSIGLNTWYHVHQIKRLDTGLVDILTSLSATAPTLPANYTVFRRVGSLRTDGSGNWLLFSQFGDEFLWGLGSSINDINTAVLGATPTLFTLRVPTGVKVWAKLRIDSIASSVLVSSPDEGNLVFNTPVAGQTTNSGTSVASLTLDIRTNISAQIQAVGPGSGQTLQATAYGWIDRRGRDS